MVQRIIIFIRFRIGFEIYSAYTKILVWVGAFENPHKNFNGHPHFAIDNTFNNQTEFTVTLPTCCFNAYNCTDVVYDVHGKFLPVRLRGKR